MKTPKPNLSVEEKMQQAREKAIALKEKERKQDEAYYLKISEGKQWKIFKVFSFYCLALALLITVETVIDGEKEKIDFSSIGYQETAMFIEGSLYTPYYEEFFGFQDTSFYVIHSPIFGAQKYLQWTSKYEDTKTPLKFTEYTTTRQNSVYDYFFFIQIVLLIPLFLVWYKRPSGLFKFGRMVCLVLIFPASVYLLFVAMGLVDLLAI